MGIFQTLIQRSAFPQRTPLLPQTHFEATPLQGIFALLKSAALIAIDSQKPADQPPSCQRTCANSSQHNDATVVSLPLQEGRCPQLFVFAPTSRTPSYHLTGNPGQQPGTVERCLQHTVGQCNLSAFLSRDKNEVLCSGKWEVLAINA